MNEIVLIVISAAVSGALSTAGTVIALRVHILYIREKLDDHHKRIDRLEQQAA